MTERQEIAALLCAAMASSRTNNGKPFDNFADVCIAMGVDFIGGGPAFLARKAYDHVAPKNAHYAKTNPEDWAEAECLIREGFR